MSGAPVETLSYEKIRLEIEGQLAIIVLDDPSKLNAISVPMAEGIMRALQEASKPRRAVRCLLIRGEGRGFCAGANLAGRGPDANGNLPILSRAEAAYHPLIIKLREFDRPVIAAVHGACVGIGLAIALQSDLILAAEDAYFSSPFVKLGSGPDGGLTWMLPHVVGSQRAKQMLLLGKRITAEMALDWGLVSEVLPSDEFPKAAREAADNLANGPTIALSEIRKLLQQAARQDFESQLSAEARALTRTFRSKDNQAGMKAFVAKTRAEFSGE